MTGHRPCASLRYLLQRGLLTSHLHPPPPLPALCGQHAVGAGPFGVFEPSHSCAELLDAAPFCRHVKFLRLVLGKAAVPEPEIDIGPAFAAAADAALGTTLKPSFSPYAANGNDLLFLLGELLRRLSLCGKQCHCFCADARASPGLWMMRNL